MTEEILYEPDVQSFVSQHIAGAMAQHVRTDVEPDASRFNDYARHHLRADRAAAQAQDQS